ncbi:SRPBCC family protein [Robiginitalea sp.]|jgi:ligand-binding SRPBCC domain-containing protein|uniref:SRPBCC family protein n=2 Tax=Robiginitalea sp. TaxID=1902411 RepID=UPI003C729558
MKLYRLHATQQLPITPEEAWNFLSNPENLQKITPARMGFQILSGTERPMYPGQIIQYNVSPIPGIRTRWVSEITHVEPGSYFVDEQRFGPYSLWHHKHFIKKTDGGVLMEDIVDYKLPLGILGSLAHPIFVRKQLSEIFRHREKALTDMFGSLPGRPTTFTIETL